ncbi:MAG: nucleotidyltransferase family protein [bacterium]|nr:nucleotidyltransferase family protein [bacterium]
MTETEELLRILKENKSLQFILEQTKELGMPNWYLGGGGIVQTVWNQKHGFESEIGIKDYDLVYYDVNDISYEAEDVFIQKGKELFKNIITPVEIRNQARVHLWYNSRPGNHASRLIDQYKSVEEAISTWPTTATAIGVRKEMDGKFQVYAPFGLEDLFSLVVKPNKKLITEKIYQNKVNRWIKVWPNLKIVPWNGE